MPEPKSTLYRWASETGMHGLPTPEELEAQGWVRVANGKRYPTSWLMKRAERDNEPAVVI